MRKYHTDVLVVGGGGAATAATIAAHEAGARTMLAVKGRFGVPGVRGAGATSNPIADFWTIRTVGPKGGFFCPPDTVYADMLQTGLGMADPKLCRIFVEEVSDAVNRLQSMGMKYHSKVLATMPANAEKGKTNSIVAIQKSIIDGTNTQVLEHANITDLLVDDGCCLGAVGVNDAGEPFLIEAGSVILAAGGVGQLFRYSFNPPGNTGDAYAMALRAGGELFNMEFFQQGLATTWPQQAMVMLYEMNEPYRVLNIDGKAFLSDYMPHGVTLEEACQRKAYHWPVSCRDAAIHLDRAIKAEVLSGRGTAHDAVFLDLSHAERGFLPELFPQFMLSKGIDVAHDLVQIQNHHHTSNGGIRIDENGQTSIRGLFSVGEAAGWQGADRLGGTMLGGSQVFGSRAGKVAAQLAKTPNGDSVNDSLLEFVFEPLKRFGASRGAESVRQMHKALQQKMWETLIVEKDEASLNDARNFVAEAKDRLANNLLIGAPIEYVLAFEQRNLLDVADVIIEAASMRKESRGSHYRSDFPQRDDERWLTNIFATHRNGDLSLRRAWVCEDVGWQDQTGDVRIKPWG